LVFIALPRFQDLVAESAPASEVVEAAPEPAPSTRSAMTGTRRRNRRPPVEAPARAAVSSGGTFAPPARSAR